MKTASLDLSRRVYTKLKHVREDQHARLLRRRAARAVSGDEHAFYDSQELFQALQDEYPPRADYGYDAHSAWWRGTQRAHWLMPLAGIQEPGARVLDVACGDGMAAAALSAYGHHAVTTDIEDWREPRARRLEFVRADVSEGIPLESGSFDVVTSYNAFIHFTDPPAALAELIRLCTPGGVVHLDFGFLYPSAWGLHAYRTVRMPYPQFLFSPDFLHEKLDELGFDAWPAALGKPAEGLIPLNGWRLGQYKELFEQSGCTVLSSSTHTDEAHLDVVERFPKAFAGLDLEVEDLATTLCSVTLRTPGGPGDNGETAGGSR